MLRLSDFKKYSISENSILFNLKGGEQDTYVNAGTNAGRYDKIDDHKEFSWSEKNDDSHPAASFQ